MTGSACTHNNTDSPCYTALLSDNTSHIIGSNMKMIHDNALFIRLVNNDLDSTLVLDKLSYDRFK